jgi:RNA-directed DNA polymerase
MWIDACENGSQTRAIFTRHPKRELHEVHYARCVAALEDKIVQAAVVAILTPIYEAEFLGFSYGFRPGRGQHDALDALAYGINARKINWILDADISRFFDTLSREWLIRFVEHRIGDRRIIRLIQKWLKAGVLEDGRLIETTEGTPQGSVASPLLANVYFITSTISGSSSGVRATQRAI